MAHFDYIKPGGVWGFFSLLSSAIMGRVDKTLYKAVNGDEGGVWAPTNPTVGGPASPIVIGGDGLNVAGPLVGANVNLTVQPDGAITVLGTPGHPGQVIWKNYAAAVWQDVATATFKSGTNLYFESGAAWSLKQGAIGNVLPGGQILLTGSGFLGGYLIAGSGGVVLLGAGSSFISQTGSAISFQAGTMMTMGCIFGVVGGLLDFYSSGALHGDSSAVANWYGSFTMRAGGTFLVESGVSGGFAGSLSVTGMLTAGSIVCNALATMASATVVGALTVNGVARSGADIPAASHAAYRALRPAEYGPDADTTLTMEAYDVLRCPAISAVRYWNLLAAVPHIIRIVVDPFVAHDLNIAVNGTPRYTVTAGLTSHITLLWDGTGVFQVSP